MGVVILVWVFFMSLWGMYTRLLMNRVKWNTKWILKTKQIHKVFLYNARLKLQITGYLIIVLGQITVLTGVQAYTSEKHIKYPWGIINFVLFFAIMIIIEITFRVLNKVELPYKRSNVILSIEEFEMRV